MQTNYSFLDLSGAIAHPAVGAYTFTGEGLGEVSVIMSEERTTHDVAADGSVMVSKIAGNNGQVHIKCQQTSAVHKWLLLLYNALIIAPPDQWAQAAAYLRNVTDKTSHIATGLSFQKVPDKSYQKQGQQITWVLMAADIQSATV
jgi:hypothetical protein